MKRPKIYIAGKITGDPKYKEKFKSIQKDLESEGYIVLNPAVLPQGLTAADYMRICFAMIDTADAVAFIEGFVDSPGAMLELEYCKYTRKNAFMVSRKDG